MSVLKGKVAFCCSEGALSDGVIISEGIFDPKFDIFPRL